jgi:lauroyl/myristoyl acyltransferase
VSVSLQHRVEYWAVMGVRALLRPLPMTAVLALGTVLGRLFHAVDASHRRLALNNL